MKIDGKSVIVTGSSGGIGRAVAVELARHGARVSCTARTDEKLQETVRLIEAEGGVSIAIPTDVTDRAQVKGMVEGTLTAFGKVDALVNNAAVFRGIGGLWEVDPEVWWADVTTNLFGPFLCCRTVLPHMMRRNKGIIINMTGGGFDGPNPGGTGYASSKAGVVRMTDTLACELGESYNIQVYALNPGFVRSGMTALLAESEQGQRWLPHVGKGLSLGQDHPAEDVGKAVVKLIEISDPSLSGRIFSYDDDFEQIARCADEIRERDLYQLRLRT